jgi:hypothetical protein
MIVCTIAAENYLHKAFVLAESLRAHDADVRLAICVPERQIHPAVADSGLFDVAFTLGDLAYPNPDQFAFRHGVLELSTAIKPRVMRAALALLPGAASVAYLDPDIVMYGPLTAARSALRDADIVVTPHHLTPPDAVTLVPLLRTGAWNLGFLGVRRSETGLAFLTWFMATLETMCYADPATGLFVDQKWMDIAGSFFPITVLRDPSYNVAHWNLQARRIGVDGDVLTVNGNRLTFIHFSGTDLGRDQRFFLRWAPRGDEPVHELRRTYKASIAQCRERFRFSTGWSYDTFDSGEPVAREARLVVRAERHLLDECERPFAQSNEYFLSRSRTH